MSPGDLEVKTGSPIAALSSTDFTSGGAFRELRLVPAVLFTWSTAILFPEAPMKRILLAAVILAPALPAAAQAPSITGVFPPGGQVGTAVTATVSGGNLADVQAVYVSGTGVKAETAMGGSAGALPLKLTIDANAEVGMREVRVVTSKGASNAGRIWVGRYPDLLEKEPNDSRSQPQVLDKLPIAVLGRSDKAEDVDTYSFTAQAGETWVFAINAAAHLSQMDGFLTLLDERGRHQSYAADNFGRDPRLIHTFKTSGKYLLQVRDTLFKGGAAHTYRLTVGRLPIVTRYSPMGGQRGTTVKVALHGINLGNMGDVQVALPAGAKEERVRVVAKTPMGPANPIDLYVDDRPEVVEAEPNDDVKSATRSGQFPVNVSGWIEKRGDRDVIAFDAKAKQVILLDVEAKRIDSRLDPVLRVLDGTGKQLATNDDGVGKDARLSFTAPADGTFYAEVRSLSSLGSDEYFYRLRITNPPAPDFQLKVSPDNPTIPAGASAVVTVTAVRAGYNDDIALRVENLPAGVTASAASLPKGSNSVVLTLTAAPGTKPVAALPRIVGTGKVGDRALERVAQGQETWSPPLAAANQKQSRDTELIVTGVGPEPPYKLEVTAPAMAVKQGQKLELTVKATRSKDYKENIAVTVVGLPAKVTASALTINGNQTEGKITLTVPAAVPVGAGPIVVQGNAKNILVAVPAQTLTIQPK